MWGCCNEEEDGLSSSRIDMARPLEPAVPRLTSEDLDGDDSESSSFSTSGNSSSLRVRDSALAREGLACERLKKIGRDGDEVGLPRMLPALPTPAPVLPRRLPLLPAAPCRPWFLSSLLPTDKMDTDLVTGLLRI